MVQKKDFQSYLYYLIWIIKSFGELMKDKLSSEYLETQFDKDLNANSLISFLSILSNNNKRYEVPIRGEYSGE